MQKKFVNLKNIAENCISTYTFFIDFYQSLGHLVLGSRLRRVSEQFFSEINKIYQAKNIAFEASWFPVFYRLSQEPAISIRHLANELQVSHSAMSQLVSHLRKKGFLITEGSDEDARKQVISLTSAGEALLDQVLPVWNEIKVAMYTLEQENPAAANFLQSLEALEDALNANPLSERVINAPTHASCI